MSNSVVFPAVEATHLGDIQYLADILHSAQRILEYLEDCTLQAFREDVKRQDKVLKKLLCISKKAQQVSASTVAAMPRIPWANMRNLHAQLVQDKAATDADMTWVLAHHEIVDLISTIRTYLPTEPTIEPTS